ncbi:hypothetical protein FB451DRAFT_1416400 [Mycena latifolia]|nr:hypothetical protein FB451DRAFT_1416400 [Mycena latifolia]
MGHNPAFPSELEREIFELAAHDQPLCILNLMLVAWRAKEWCVSVSRLASNLTDFKTEPLLYRTLVFGPFYLKGPPSPNAEAFAALIQSETKPASLFHRTAGHLLIGDCRLLPAAGLILSTCPGDLTALFDGVADFTHPLFSNITHLEVFYIGNGNTAGSGFALIPHLTLSFEGYNHRETKPAPLTLLQKCRSLRVLIYLRRSADVGLSKHACDNELAEDPRIVYMTSAAYVADWQIGAHTGADDYWARAKAFIAKRLCGEIDRKFLNSWDVPVLDSVIAIVVQTFYCWRICFLRKGIVIPAAVFLVLLTQFSAGIYTGIRRQPTGTPNGTPPAAHQNRRWETIWLVGGAVAYTAIATVLSWTLLRERSYSLPSNHSMISRLIRLIVEINALDAGVAVIAVILFWACPRLLPHPIIEKLYANCLLALFNNRSKEANTKMNSHGIVSLHLPPNSESRENSDHHGGNGVNVNVKVHVKRETLYDPELNIQPPSAPPARSEAGSSGAVVGRSSIWMLVLDVVERDELDRGHSARTSLFLLFYASVGTAVGTLRLRVVQTARNCVTYAALLFGCCLLH